MKPRIHRTRYPVRRWGPNGTIVEEPWIIYLPGIEGLEEHSYTTWRGAMKALHQILNPNRDTNDQH